jgi:integrase
MMRQIVDGGFRIEKLSQLKGRHVEHILDIWQGVKPDPETGKVRGIAHGVQAVRLSTLRKLCKAAGKPGLVPRLNKRAGITPRERTPVANVAWKLTATDLAKIPTFNARLVLRLQREFGLRKKEAWLLDARSADRGTTLRVEKGTKGGRPRSVPIETQQQRDLLALVKEANARTPEGTLVPGASLKSAFDTYKRDMASAGLSRAHGLRHQYAQDRYQALTGMACPKSGGLLLSQMSDNDRAKDAQVRQVLAAELGHGRIAVVSVYIGSGKELEHAEAS